MNVLFLSEILHPHGGGAELATLLYAKLLSRSGVNIKIVTSLFPGEKDREKCGNLDIVRIPMLSHINAMKYSILRNSPILFSSFLRRCIKWSDVAYIPLYWYSAIPMIKAYRKPVVIHLHNYILSCPLGTLYNFSSNAPCQKRRLLICPSPCILSHEQINGRKVSEILASTFLNSVTRDMIGNLASLSDAIICVSKAQKDLTLRTCGRSLERKLRVIYNPVPDFSYAEMEGRDFGFFGGCNYLKGFHVLYDAVNILRRNNKKALRIHVTKSQRVSSAAQVILNEKGFVLHGKLDESQYAKLYGHLRCVIVPSIWHEPLPYVVTEALMRGRIIIASNVGGIGEIVEGCKGVQLFDPGDSKKLSEAISYVNELSSEEAVEWGIKNRQEILRKFDNSRIAKNFIEILTETALAY